MEKQTLRTPLYTKHLQLGARMVPFAGYSMPVQYSGVLEESRATRSACGLFDVSHMGQFSVRGKSSIAELNKLVTNDLTKIQLGQAQYNMLCNDTGGVIDDLVIYRRSNDETFICVNASNRHADFDWLKSHLPSSVQLMDESDATALIAVQGPNAEKILSLASNPNTATSLNYYWAAETTVFGEKCYLSRTGYTGEDGYELYVSANKAGDIWDKLLEVGQKFGLVPCGLGARDTLRTEMGYPLHGHEISPTISPLSAGLGWVVRLKKSEPFTAKQLLQKENELGPPKVLRAFVIQDRRIARAGYRIYTKGQEFAGEITSGTFSPHLNTPIALGFVNNEVKDDPEYLIEIRDEKVSAKVVKLPFVPSHTKKTAKT